MWVRIFGKVVFGLSSVQRFSREHNSFKSMKAISYTATKHCTNAPQWINLCALIYKSDCKIHYNGQLLIDCFIIIYHKRV